MVEGKLTPMAADKLPESNLEDRCHLQKTSQYEAWENTGDTATDSESVELQKTKVSSVPEAVSQPSKLQSTREEDKLEILCTFQDRV